MLQRPKVRLFVPQEISEYAPLRLPPDQSHYLTGVMRLDAGSEIEIFNGTSEAWVASITRAHRKQTEVTPVRVAGPFQSLSNLWLLFAPIKKARTDFIVEKATELGVSKIIPVFTEFTNAERLRTDRLRAHAIEAAEQCGGTAIPEVLEPQKLREALSNWPDDRHLFFADEATAGDAAKELPKGPAAILIGPEGGFSEAERKWLHGLENLHVLHLGQRILRADTAAVSAITRWQAEVGDWA